MQNLNLPDGLYMRPARDSDRIFMESLYKSTRDDLRLIDAEEDFIEELIDMQQNAQSEGYGDKFPNAMYFIIEKHNERVGRVVVDFGPNEVRLVDIAIIPAARGNGFGKGVIQALQMAAAKICVPLTLCVYKTNVDAYRLYLSLGFQVADTSPTNDMLMWYPETVESKIFTSGG